MGKGKSEAKSLRFYLNILIFVDHYLFPPHEIFTFRNSRYKQIWFRKLENLVNVVPEQCFDHPLEFGKRSHIPATCKLTAFAIQIVPGLLTTLLSSGNT
jgi:hypothetical protein